MGLLSWFRRRSSAEYQQRNASYIDANGSPSRFPRPVRGNMPPGNASVQVRFEWPIPRDSGLVHHSPATIAQPSSISLEQAYGRLNLDGLARALEDASQGLLPPTHEARRIRREPSRERSPSITPMSTPEAVRRQASATLGPVTPDRQTSRTLSPVTPIRDRSSPAANSPSITPSTAPSTPPSSLRDVWRANEEGRNMPLPNEGPPCTRSGCRAFSRLHYTHPEREGGRRPFYKCDCGEWVTWGDMGGVSALNPYCRCEDPQRSRMDIMGQGNRTPGRRFWVCTERRCAFKRFENEADWRERLSLPPTA